MGDQLSMKDIVDISSSDSEVEIEDGRGKTHSANMRYLPTTLSGSGTNSSSRGKVDYGL